MITPQPHPKLDKDEISDFGRRTVVSPGTRVQLSVTKLLGGIAAIVVFTTGVFGAYTGVSRALEAHIANHDVHLDSDYYRAHGQVIGQFDLAVTKAEIKGIIDASAAGVRQDLDALRRELAVRDRKKAAP